MCICDLCVHRPIQEMNSNDGSVWKRRRSKEILTDDEKSHISTNNKKNKTKIKNKKFFNNKKNTTQKEYPLLRFEELPEYMKDNEFILNYYRSDWPLKQAFFSLFHWHNETLNVWTHLIGFVVFLGLTITNLMHVPQVSEFLNLLTWSFPITPGGNASHNSIMGTPKLIDLKHESPLDMEFGPPLTMATRWPFFVFLGGSMFCLLSSSTCHLFGCHSHHLNLLLLQMDYVGITIMIITSFFPPIYYIFQCEPLWQFVYLGGITTMGVFTVVTLLAPALSSGKFRSFRAFLFMGMGLFGIVPAIHAVMVNWYEPQRNGILVYEIAMAVSYLTGTMFYITRIPERWKPGWFDLAGHSHQIFHCFVIMGALAHYGAAVVFLEHRGRVWDVVKRKADFPVLDSNWDSIVNGITQKGRSRSVRTIVIKLVFAAAVYFVWQERNNCLFSNKKRSRDQLAEVILSTVRLKLMTFRFKKSRRVEELLIAWHVPLSL